MYVFYWQLWKDGETALVIITFLVLGRKFSEWNDNSLDRSVGEIGAGHFDVWIMVLRGSNDSRGGKLPWETDGSRIAPSRSVQLRCPGIKTV
jgi:hypothetical protein